MSTVLDASAILAFLQNEKGSDTVEQMLISGSVCGAANWSEVTQKVLAAGGNWDLVQALLESYEIRVESVTRADAEWAASRWKRGEGLSLADRLCLALGERLDAEVLTSDTAWSTEGRVRQIR